MVTFSRELLSRADTAYYSLWRGELQAKVYMNRRKEGVSSATILVRRKTDPVMVYTFAVKAGSPGYLTPEDWVYAMLTQISSVRVNTHTLRPEISISNEDDWLTPDPW